MNVKEQAFRKDFANVVFGLDILCICWKKKKKKPAKIHMFKDFEVQGESRTCNNFSNACIFNIKSSNFSDLST